MTKPDFWETLRQASRSMRYVLEGRPSVMSEDWAKLYNTLLDYKHPDDHLSLLDEAITEPGPFHDKTLMAVLDDFSKPAEVRLETLRNRRGLLALGILHWLASQPQQATESTEFEQELWVGLTQYCMQGIRANRHLQDPQFLADSMVAHKGREATFKKAFEYYQTK